MPIEVKELHINISVTQEDDPKSATSSNNGQADNTNNNALVKACVEKVLEIIRAEKER